MTEKGEFYIYLYIGQEFSNFIQTPTSDVMLNLIDILMSQQLPVSWQVTSVLFLASFVGAVACIDLLQFSAVPWMYVISFAPSTKLRIRTMSTSLP